MTSSDRLLTWRELAERIQQDLEAVAGDTASENTILVHAVEVQCARVGLEIGGTR